MAHDPLGAVFAIIKQIHTTKSVTDISLPNDTTELKELLKICESLHVPIKAAAGSIFDAIKMLERKEERQRMLDEEQADAMQEAAAKKEAAAQPKVVSSYVGRAAAASITPPLQEKIINKQPDSRIPVARKNFMTEMYTNNSAVFARSFRFPCKHETREGGCNNGHTCNWTHSSDYSLAKDLRDGKYKCTPCI